MSSLYVLDSFALLALLRNEPGGRVVHGLIEAAIAGECALLMSTINLGEVLYHTERRHGTRKVKETLVEIEALPIRILGATRRRVLAAVHLKANHPISYADAFAAGLAQEFDGALVTGDPEFRGMGQSLRVAWLGAD